MVKSSAYNLFYKTWLLATLTALIMLGCGGGGSSSAPGTGSVSILLTDGPSEDFDEINLTITEIRLLGNEQQVVIFQGQETINLLDLKNHADLFALKDEVPEGSYEKIRLILSDVALINKNDVGDIIEEHHPQLPANGKIDLNPRGSFYISADETTNIQIDIDADKAIHIKETGNGKYKFRPVVFVDVVDSIQPGKLIRNTGVVYLVEENSFVMCKSVIISSTETISDDCIRVNVDQAALFNSEGDVVTLGELAINDPVIVYGKLSENIDNDEITIAEDTPEGEKDVEIALTLDAIMVAIGSPDSFMKIGGIVSADYDATSGSFDMTVDPNQGFTTGSVLSVLLNEVTPVITKAGDLSDPSILVAGTVVQSKGVLMVGNNDALKSVLVIADLVNSSTKIEGSITFVSEDFSSINVETETGEVCVDISSETKLQQIADSDSVEVLANQLELNAAVEVYGVMSEACMAAESILVLP